jgi:hypothetical protein
MMVDAGESSYAVWFTPSDPEDWGSHTFSVKGNVPNVPGYEMEASFTVTFANRKTYCTPVIPMSEPISREYCITAIKDDNSGIAGKYNFMQVIKPEELSSSDDMLIREYGPCVDNDNRPMTCEWIIGSADKFCEARNSSPGGFFTLTCFGDMMEYVDDGWWMMTFKATNQDGVEIFQSFGMLATYDMSEETMLALPPLKQESNFSGTVLQSYATETSAKLERQIQPFVENLSEDNVLRIGFNTEVKTHETLAVEPVALSNLRKLRHANTFSQHDVRFQDVYDIVEPIEIELTSSATDEEPLKVDWDFKSSSETNMEIQLYLDDVATDIDISNYDGVQLTFNNPELFRPVDESSDKVLPVGKAIQWNSSRQINREEANSLGWLATSVVSLAALVVVLAIAIACFKGSLLSTWMFINSL